MKTTPSPPAARSSPAKRTRSIVNVVLCGQGSSGKTTLIDKVAHPELTIKAEDQRPRRGYYWSSHTDATKQTVTLHDNKADKDVVVNLIEAHVTRSRFSNYRSLLEKLSIANVAVYTFRAQSEHDPKAILRNVQRYQSMLRAQLVQQHPRWKNRTEKIDKLMPAFVVFATCADLLNPAARKKIAEEGSGQGEILEEEEEEDEDEMEYDDKGEPKILNVDEFTRVLGAAGIGFRLVSNVDVVKYGDLRNHLLDAIAGRHTVSQPESANTVEDEEKDDGDDVDADAMDISVASNREIATVVPTQATFKTGAHVHAVVRRINAVPLTEIKTEPASERATKKDTAASVVGWKNTVLDVLAHIANAL